MEINEKQLRLMYEEHKARGGEVETLLARALAKAEYPLDEEEFKTIFNQGVKYFRHVGAIWALSSILKGDQYDWEKVGKTENNETR